MSLTARLRGLSAGLLVACLASSSRAAGTPNPAACIAAHEEGQRQRRDGNLLGARQRFRSCADETCPELARRDCLDWERDLEAAIPSVVVGARTSSGADVTDLSLRIDGQLVQSKLSGVPVEINPGAHVVAVEGPVGSKEERVLVRSGEKNRLVSLIVDGPQSSGAAVAADAASVEAPRATSAFPWIVTGAGAALAAAGVTLEAVGVARIEGLRDDCAPSCSAASVDGARYTIIAGDLLLVTGVAALIGGVYLVVRARTSAAARGGFRW